MGSLLQQEVVEQESLFVDVLEEAGIMPVELEKYDKTINNKIVNEAAEQLMVYWIKRQNEGIIKRLGTTTDLRPPCEAPKLIATFFPDFPDVEDYAPGIPETEDEVEKKERWARMTSIALADPEFQRLHARADIDMAKAKRVCWEECPVRLLCLAQATRIDTEYEPGEMFANEDIFTVRGGWGPGALKPIASRFHVLRRTYQNGEMSESTREELESAAEQMQL